MISSFDTNNLNKLLKDFYTAVGIRISVFDDNFNLVTEYPKNAPAFCSNIRSTQDGRNACKACDNAAFERAKKLRKPHIYTCHAGITEAITPIQIGGGILGYAILAHMLPKENYGKTVDNACALAENLGVPQEVSRQAITEIIPRTEEQINAAVRLLDAVSSYVYIQNLAKWKNEDVSQSLDKYIKDNLGERLNSDVICRQFNCSRTALYKISMQAFGMGIMQYIVYCRIERAKQLLSENKSIAETASLCGFEEYNYFCKVFRKHTGTSPNNFRKNVIK